MAPTTVLATSTTTRAMNDDMTTSSSAPKPPYYAVIFTNTKRSTEGYSDVAQNMVDLASQQPGYLGIESISDGNSTITISYWRSRADILAWKQNPQHITAQTQGREKWYQDYSVRICLVESAYDFSSIEQ